MSPVLHIASLKVKSKGNGLGTCYSAAYIIIIIVIIIMIINVIYRPQIRMYRARQKKVIP